VNSARRIANPVEGFLSFRVRGVWFAGLLALLAAVCVAQDQGQNAAGTAQSQAGQSSSAQGSQGGAEDAAHSKPADGEPASPSEVVPAQAAPDPNAPTQAAPDRNIPGQVSPNQAPANQAAPTGAKAKQKKSNQGKPVSVDPNPPQPTSPQKTAQQNLPAPSQGPITLEGSETIFATLTALNACGYDRDLTTSDATRSNVRAEVQRNIEYSEAAQAARSAVCDFYLNHVSSKDANRNLSQYISLALYMNGPPHFMPLMKVEELPPDAGTVAGFSPLLETFYEKAGLHSIWERHRNDYAAAMRRYHEPLAKMVFDTEVYLKRPSSQYLGRTFTIYLDFMGSPGVTDARNYGTAYYVVVFPTPSGSGPATESALKMEQIRHTFLHYELDPLADKNFTAIKRLEPLLRSVQRAPMEESFKTDISLLVTECLVRAIEIRTSGNKQTAEALRTQAVDDAVKQGYILTKYFYDAIVAFEKDPQGIQAAYPALLENVNLKKEETVAAGVEFASSATPELVRLSRPEERRMLVTAERRLAAGDPKGAQELAQAALDKKIGDQGRALFILAEVAVANRNRDGAQDNFQKAIAATTDPTVLGWSHVYLGRILDMKEDREAALVEYQAALKTSGTLPEIKTAAERGLKAAYEPPAKAPVKDTGK
jgi:tetratricopeptide (TPR) repeat protein